MVKIVAIGLLFTSFLAGIAQEINLPNSHQNTQFTSNFSQSFSEDLNNDGLNDVIGITKNDQQLKLFLASENGHNKEITINTSVKPLSINLADIDKDGFIDILYSSKEGSLMGTEHGKLVWIKNSNGTFKRENTIFQLFQFKQFLAEDFDEDGDIDILATDNKTGIISFLKNTNSKFSYDAFDPNRNVKTNEVYLKNIKKIQSISSEENTAFSRLMNKKNNYETLSCDEIVIQNIPKDTSICLGEVAKFSISASGKNLTYQWQQRSGISFYGLSDNNEYEGTKEALISIKNVALIQNGYSYRCIITDSCGNKDTSSIATLTVNNLPNITVGSDTSFCEGTSIKLSVTEGAEYLWSPTTGLSTHIIQNPIASPEEATVYTALVTDENGCKNEDSLLVEILEAPDQISLEDQSICFGDSILLEVEGGATYQWSPTNGLSSPTEASTYAKPTKSLTYSITSTAQNGCSTFDYIQIDVKSLPNITVSESQEICIKDSIELIATGDGNISWSSSALNDDITKDTIKVSPSQSALYVAIVTDTNNCQSSDNAYITVNELPDIEISDDIAICEGEIIVLTASGGLNYKWLPDGEYYDNELPAIEVGPGVSTTYKLSVSDHIGCTSYDSVTVTVNEEKSTEITEVICKGDSVEVQGDTVKTEGIYYDTLQTTKGCDSIITTFVEYNPLKVTIDEDLNILTAVLNSDDENVTYTWYNCIDSTIIFEDVLFNEYDAGQDGSYAVIVKNEDGCIDTSDCSNALITNIESYVYDVDVELYPNPVKNTLHISIPPELVGGRARVTSSNGQIIDEFVTSDSLFKVDVSDYTNGWYMFQLVQEGNAYISKPFIKD